MHSFVKLPSGRFFDVGNIKDTEKELYVGSGGEKDSLFTVYLKTLDEEGSDVCHFEGSDARALYAYLDSIAVAIGEDGKPVEDETPKAGSETGDLDEGEVALSPRAAKALHFLNNRPGQTATTIRAKVGANITILSKLKARNLVEMTYGDGVNHFVALYAITDAGRRAIGKDIGK